MFQRSLKVNLLRKISLPPIQSSRSATVLRRVNDPPLLGPYATPYQIDMSVFKDNKYRRYEVVTEDDEANTADEPIKIIMLRSMEDYGKRGQVLSLARHLAHKELLLPGLACYASPENLELHKDIIIDEDSIQFSSDVIRKVLPRISRMCIPVIMSRNHSWTIEPWHIKTALRNRGLEVSNVNSIKLPEMKIEGPNLEFESKEFPIWLKVNDFETVPLRCIIYHWSPEDDGIDECPPPGWDVRFHEPIFEKFRELLRFLPREKLDPGRLTHLKDKQDILQKYESWRKERDQKFFSS